MATPQEIEEILGIIRRAWGKNPELRLCQLLSNAALMHSWNQPDLYYMEDEALITDLKLYIKKDQDGL